MFKMNAAKMLWIIAIILICLIFFSTYFFGIVGFTCSLCLIYMLCFFFWIGS